MKKQLLVLSSLFLISCGGSDLLNSQEEVQTLKALDKNSLAQSKTSSLTNKTGTIVMDLSFAGRTINPDNGGCSFQVTHDGVNFYDSTSAFGPNPLNHGNYIIRGYGKPRKSIDWDGLRFEAWNRPKIIVSRGQTMTVNDPLSNAISIEFPFQSNLTYEITIDTNINDQIYEAKHNQYSWDDKFYNVNQSQSFATVALELTDSPQIRGNDPCAARPVVNNSFVSRYYKKQQAVIATTPSYEQKIFTYNFSLITNQNALILYFLPELNQNIPESHYFMNIQNIKIVQKPFDPTYLPPPTRDSAPNPCPGYRVCP